MSIKDINSSPDRIRMWTDHIKGAEEQYYIENPDSFIPLFEQEMRDLGFEFETSGQILGFIPKHKKEILPVAVKYYQLAKKLDKPNEQNYFMSFFYIRGLDEMVPMLLADYYSEKTEDITRWFISDCIYHIRSGNFVKEYLDIVSDKMFGRNRQMFVLLLGKLKEESAVPALISLLEDEEVCLQAICALGEFKRNEFRSYFERFLNSAQPGWRKYAKNALKKLKS